MKSLSDLLTEKLHINKNYQNAFNPDDFNNDNIKLWNSEDDDQDIEYQDLESWLDNLSDKFDGFIRINDEPLSKNDNFENVCTYDDDVTGLVLTLLTGRDAGYEIRLVSGHIEVDAINSGCRRHFYIYALTKNANELVCKWLDDEEDVSNLKFLFKKGYIAEIQDI